jgi:hypothetical protein
MLSIEEVNAKIKEGICHETIEKLDDAILMPEYKECDSVKNEITKLSNILGKYPSINDDTRQKIIDEYLPQLIPAGTKGVIRGNKFNRIVKEHIESLNLDKDIFEVCFEKNCSIHITSEIPDWYILDKINNKVLIGMNQLDLWSGGAQTNRGSKYIFNNEHNSSNSKLLCVVCNEIPQFKNNKKKVYKIFEKGFENNTLCYLNNLNNIINQYFSI